MQRRTFLLAAAAPLAASPSSSWRPGSVAHLLATVSDCRLILKTSLREPLLSPPQLLLDGGRPAPGRRTDSQGYYWAFDLLGLDPGRRYTLTLTSSRGKPLCDPWPLRTAPSPNERPKRLRVGIYTCAGGHQAIRDDQGRGVFLPLATRQSLFDRLLAFEPDAVIAIGDHVYWDQRSIIGRPGDQSAQQIRLAGAFQRAHPIFGTPNEDVLIKATAPQIAELYGTRFRSTPVWFVQDDHDLFDNDEASDHLVTLPPDAFMVRAARATRRLFYPEFLPDANRPDGLAGSFACEPNATCGESFGTLRWGRLAEFLIYDCRRHLSLGGPTAGFVPETAEQWLIERTRSRDTRHLVHVPAVPFGWSAGKWGEWYADILDERGKLTIAKPKPYWQSGWRAQHDRILAALAANRDRTPLLISGDLHCHALGRIWRSGSIDLSANPITVALAGPISTGPTGWPSAARGTVAQTAIGIEMDTRLPVVEHNGFTIADLTEDSVRWNFYGWKAEAHSPASLAHLKPFFTENLP